MFSPVRALREWWRRRGTIKELKSRVQKLIDRKDSCVTSGHDEDCMSAYYLELGFETGITRIGGLFRVLHDGDCYIEGYDGPKFIDIEKMDYVLQLLRTRMVLEDLADA